MFWNSATCNYENGKYLASTIDDLTIVCDEVIDVDAVAKLNDEAETTMKQKLFPQISMKRKQSVKRKNSYILLTFLLITTTLLIAVSI